MIALLLAVGGLAGCTGGAASGPWPTRIPAAARAGSGAGSWETAQRVPGLSPGPVEEFGAVACAPGGECTAVGSLAAGGLFAITDKKGAWGTMTRIPVGAGRTVLPGTQLSCPAAGDCTAVGIYLGSQLALTIFVAQEAGGTWGAASPLPGVPAIDTPSGLTLACPAPGSCTVAGGTFVADEVNGTWRRPADIPGRQALGLRGTISAFELSCPAPGYCTLIGSYSTSATATWGRQYIASEANGTWGTAIRVPGATALTTAAGVVNLDSLSCSAPGDCGAVGWYAAGVADADPRHAFVVAESGGTWSAASPLPGMESLRVIDCPDAGECVAGGTDAQGKAAIVREARRRWGSPAEIPGPQALAFPGKKAGSAVNMLACPTAATCTAAGWSEVEGIIDPQAERPSQPFLAGEVRGTWGTARVPPGMAPPGVGWYPELAGLACAAPGDCAAGGFYIGRDAKSGDTFIMAEAPAG